jgi:hypothetical protein
VARLIRNGWIVPIPADVTEFDIEFQWHIESAAMWRVYPKDDWEVRHLIHIKLHPGKGITYSMDGSCWPEREGPAMRITPFPCWDSKRKTRLSVTGVRSSGLRSDLHGW